MASGIAHDINNAISPVGLYTEALLEQEPNLSDRARQDLGIIQRAIADVAHTVSRMGEFYRARDSHAALAPVRANPLVAQVLDLTRARWSDMPQQRGIVIRTSTELAPDLPPVLGVESEIREALTNLVFNAVDAMPAGGTLTVRSRLTVAESPLSVGSVVVEVADDGAGMDEETRRLCLEPFFTTKGERGTGLGLAMVYGVAQRHGAEVEIESAPGEGTTVRLVFPVPASVSAPMTSAPFLAIRPLRILVVDDDPLILKALRDVLGAEGHIVVAAGGGQAGIDALHAAIEAGEPFSLVVSDLGMPYVDGRQVAAAVKEASASTPVIMLTGWGQRLIAEGDVPVQVDRVLSKPPKLRELREALAYCASLGEAGGANG
jgi:CheY-like chemotaxis protein/anti-sigma regulatory factor (Ser/Thr protein kinase)